MENVKSFKSELLQAYSSSLSTINELVEQIRTEAKSISPGNNSRIKEIKSKLFSIASEIEKCKKSLEKEINSIETETPNKDSLYEITQLLNSMMGIVALPYEMHKEYFKNVGEDKRSDENKDLTKNDLQSKAQIWEETAELRKLICEWYVQGKWVTTYTSDISDGYLKKNIVFGFLSHMRNAVCHSGDGAISILPLDDGVVIKEVLFHDTLEGQEFALLVSTGELYELVEAIAKFYRNSPIGSIDKSGDLKKMELNVKNLLNTEKNKVKVPSEWIR
jgi:hypothetical protein